MFMAINPFPIIFSSQTPMISIYLSGALIIYFNWQTIYALDKDKNIHQALLKSKLTKYLINTIYVQCDTHIM